MQKKILKENAATILSCVIDNRVLYIISSIFLFLLLHKPIELFLGNFFVTPLLFYVEQAWYNDIFIIAAAVVFSVYSFFKPTFSTFKSKGVYLLLVVIYSIYRFNFFPVWDFTTLSFFYGIKLLDVIYIIPLGQMIRWIALKLKKEVKDKVNNDPLLLTDSRTILNKDNDILDFIRYANNLADKINKIGFNDEAYAIGIEGRWGSGKTTFIDYLKTQLSNDNYIKIELFPWDSINSESIVKDCLEKIYFSICKQKPSLAKTIWRYYNRLVEINDSTLNKTIYNILGIFNTDKSLREFKEEINNELKHLNKKIIIFIDDIDRLDKKEVIEVLRLIRNTANFSNCIYIATYDKGYVSNALKDINDYNHESFLEKIFQLELTIPVYEKKVLFNELSKIMTKYFPNVDQSFLSNGSEQITNKLVLEDWLENMRDVKRLANNMIVYFGAIEDDVNYDEFLKLEILRIKHPSVYNLLFFRRNEFLSNNNIFSPITHFAFNRDTFISILKTEDVNEKEHGKIASLVSNIFTFDQFGSSDTRRALSICIPANFHKYFKHLLLNTELSEKDFTYAIKQDLKLLLKKINNWVIEGKTDSLKGRLERIKDFSSKNDFEKVISAIMHFARISWSNGSLPHSYDLDKLISQITSYRVWENTTFYNNEQEYAAFFRSLFKDNAESPFYIESYIINGIYTQYYVSGFPIDKEELKDLLLSYLKKYCAGIEKLDNYVLYLYSNCILTEWEKELTFANGVETSSPHKVVIKGATEIVKGFISEKDVDGFILSIINKAGMGRYNINIANFNHILSSFSDLEAFINEQDENKWKYLKEFKTFLNELESNIDHNGFIPSITFNFQKIDLN